MVNKLGQSAEVKFATGHIIPFPGTQICPSEQLSYDLQHLTSSRAAAYHGKVTLGKYVMYF